MKRYVAQCEWDGYNWVATVDGLPGAVTQAKRLELLSERLVEVIKLMTGSALLPDQITLSPHIDPEIDAVTQEIVGLQRDLERADAALAERRRRVVKDLHRRGFTLRDIGVLAHVSHQRVHQLLEEGSTRR